MKSLVLLAIASVSVAGLLQADPPGEAKHSIKEVMAKAHKGKLLNKVLDGQATAEDKMVLLDHYISLRQNKPPKGEQAEWERRTDRIVLAAAKMAVGREGVAKELRAATNCSACHSTHR